MSPYVAPGIQLTTQVVDSTACIVWGITQNDLESSTRKRPVIDAKHAVRFYRTSVMKIPHHKVAREFKCNQQSVYNSGYKVEALLQTDKSYREKYSDFEKRLSVYSK